MKKNYIVKSIFTPATLIMIGMLLISSCGKKKDNNHDAHEDPGAVKIDSDLAHLLKPTNEQVVSTLPLIKAEYGTKIFTVEAQGIINYDTRNENSVASRVTGRIERLLIKYNYQPVKKGQLIMEVYSPDLAAAQQELLFLRNSNDHTMLEGAKQRLLLLGMSASGVNQLLKTGKVNYRIPVYSNANGYILEKSAAAAPASAPSAATPAAGGDGMSGMSGGGAAAPAPSAAPVSSPVMLREGQYVSAGQSLFTIYNADRLVAEFSLKPAMASLVRKGDKFAFYKTADKSTIQTATIGMIQPVFKNGENFTIARVYLNKPDFRVGELLTARIPVLLAASWWLPESAVVMLGNKTIVFKKEGNVVIPKPVNAGITIGGMVQIKEDISNWEISKNASYLVDSESFIK
ncbi:efflux RND transporter periplasmic adaptor subunit [Pedobacter nyackensis]|uniref:Multidrug efflux pump subunit AcrA (Membrane-fusion protein) n=1 Tax=Pedobacter nyackensis TaxID=475255 RepID=A0A1W2F235_9SPHI|nr:efflux RND transporter periplasmic adaptor subunit [Pedobacter nyackensis]SMD15548.1 Multidrug efflux pump subunit AcrA (membrane-fusion protein) [Pedobacter nyackensis]